LVVHCNARFLRQVSEAPRLIERGMKMIVQNSGNLICVSDEFRYEMLTREEALQMIEDLTEAVKACPVDIRKGEA